MRQVKRTNSWIECKTIDPMASGVNQHGRSAINNVACGYLFVAFLKEIFFASSKKRVSVGFEPGHPPST